MVASKLEKYLDKRDKNGIKVSEWAIQGQPSKAICSVCVPRRTIDSFIEF